MANGQWLGQGPRWVRAAGAAGALEETKPTAAKMRDRSLGARVHEERAAVLKAGSRDSALRTFSRCASIIRKLAEVRALGSASPLFWQTWDWPLNHVPRQAISVVCVHVARGKGSSSRARRADDLAAGAASSGACGGRRFEDDA